jgi:hypothetical protein
MRLSALRSPRLFRASGFRFFELAWWSQTSDAFRAARAFFHVVIAGLDPAIHATSELAHSHCNA